MRSVLDESAGLKIVMNERDTDKALRVRDDFRNSVIDLIAPDHSETISERVKSAIAGWGSATHQNALAYEWRVALSRPTLPWF